METIDSLFISLLKMEAKWLKKYFMSQIAIGFKHLKKYFIESLFS